MAAFSESGKGLSGWEENHSDVLVRDHVRRQGQNEGAMSKRGPDTEQFPAIFPMHRLAGCTEVPPSATAPACDREVRGGDFRVPAFHSWVMQGAHIVVAGLHHHILPGTQSGEGGSEGYSVRPWN